MMPADSLPDSITQTVDVLARYELAAPALLFVASHRPLAFVAGQTLYGLAPLGALLGVGSLGEWAGLLSEPSGAAALMEALHDAA